jgi:hypothetical protein
VQPFGSSQHFMETEGSLPRSPILSQTNPVTTPNPISKGSILLLFIYLRLGFISGLFTAGLPATNLYTFLFSPFVLNVPPNSSFQLYNSNYTWRRLQIGAYYTYEYILEYLLLETYGKFTLIYSLLEYVQPFLSYVGFGILTAVVTNFSAPGI